MADYKDDFAVSAADHLSKGYERLTQLRALLLSSSTEPQPTSLTIDLLDKSLFCLSNALSQLKISPRTSGASSLDVNSNKRKRRLHSWTITTTVPHFDGHEWRKYGQKRIHGAAFPRSYYKCAHGKEEGCLATKTVQQLESSADPPQFEVSYSLRHTCKDMEADPLLAMDSSTATSLSLSGAQEASPQPLLSDLQDANYEAFSEPESLMEAMLIEAGELNAEQNMEQPFGVWDIDLEWASSHGHDI
ncbi:hypothetical protein HPP92_007300 [Vanilla planifolia]|uniref:WRKY domain-containing protein n=1 Tax=Vanilla planifolia TaxID=51239 RepID=A0A835RQX5_VANPL|nr:hypothetical protein HPP92_007300 [Vanilla planifolia]